MSPEAQLYMHIYLDTEIEYRGILDYRTRRARVGHIWCAITGRTDAERANAAAEFIRSLQRGI